MLHYRYTPDPGTGLLASYSRAAAAIGAMDMQPKDAVAFLERVRRPMWMAGFPSSMLPAAVSAWCIDDMPEGAVATLFRDCRTLGLLPTVARRFLALDAAIETSAGRFSAEGIRSWMAAPSCMVTVIDEDGKVRACEGRAALEIGGGADLFGRPVEDLVRATGSEALRYLIEDARADRDTAVECGHWWHQARRTGTGVLVLSEIRRTVSLSGPH